jgi:hypothetical protein
MARPKLNTVVLDFVGGAGASIINIPRALSLANRKSFRQGYVYSVDFIEVIAASDNQVFTIAKLPENYNVLGGYRLGFDHWREQRAMAISESDIQPGKWSDFKPWFNQDHADLSLTELHVRGMGSGYVLQPLDVTLAEWNMADMEVHDVAAATTTRYPIGMLGASNAGAGAEYGGLIDAWGDTRTATVAPDPLTPNLASQSWILRTGATSEEMSGEVIQLIEDENDFPPYANQTDVALAPTYVGNAESAPYGMMVDMGTTGSTGRALTLDGGLFPLGYLVVQNAGVEDYTIRVHVTRGTYKGAVAALPMGDFS